MRSAPSIVPSNYGHGKLTSINRFSFVFKIHHKFLLKVKKAEKELEQKLCEKRGRLRIQLANEEREYFAEINEKYRMQREFEISEQCKSLERLRMEREMDRQKYIEMKRLQQQMCGHFIRLHFYFQIFFDRAIIRFRFSLVM